MRRGTCDLPPAGWFCTLDAGHEGPCPTVPEDGSPFATPALEVIERDYGSDTIEDRVANVAAAVILVVITLAFIAAVGIGLLALARWAL